MKKLLVSLLIVILFIGIIFLIMILDKTPELLNDEDIVYTKAFDEEILQVKRYDYSLGQRMIIGVDEDDPDFKSSGLTGGEKSHTLTVAEMPFHNHSLYIEGTIIEN